MPDNLAWRAERAAISLARALSSGLINPEIKRIVEFGAGSGGSTFALARFAEVIGADLDVVEIEDADVIWKQRIVLPEHVIESDGIIYLDSLSEKRIRPYDLITAFMLGPDIKATLFRQLGSACVKALNPTGTLMITSDSFTLRAAVDACNSFRVRCNFVKGIFNLTGTDTLLVPQSECWKFKPE